MEHPIRKQFREDLCLAGLAESSQASYLEAVDMFFKRTWLKPEDVTQQNFADYLKRLQDSAAAKGTFKVARFAVAFLLRNTMRHDWPIFKKSFARQGRQGFPKRSRTRTASR
jgi:hypothetical protein